MDDASRFSVTTFGKAGVHYVNETLDNTAFGTTTSDSYDGVAFVGEVGVTGAYHVTSWLSLDTGYQLLFLEGVATAAEQTSSVDALAPSADINSGGVFYHGFLFGASATW